MAILVGIHRLHGNLLGVDAHATRSLAFGVGSSEIELLRTDDDRATCGERLLLGLAILQVVVRAGHREGLRADDDVAFSRVAGLRELTFVVDLHIG